MTAIDISLPVFGGNAVGSLLGTMMFPDDPSKAELYAAHFIAKALGDVPGAAALIGSEAHQYIHSTSTRYVGVHDEAQRNAYRGTKAGALVAYLWHAGPKVSWQDAIKAATKNRGYSMARSSFLKSTAEFGSVLHYWGMLSIQYENRLPKDVPLFVSQSMQLLRLMRGRERCGELGGSSFSSPKVIVPFTAIDWRVDGFIPKGEVNSLFAPNAKKPAGRPRAAQS